MENKIKETKTNKPLQETVEDNKKEKVVVAPETSKSDNNFRDFQEILENELRCAICQDIYINPLILNCSHSFCKFCVYRWLTKRRGCPQCRMTVSFQAENLALRNLISKMVQKSSPQFQTARADSVKQRLKDEEEQENEGTSRLLIKDPIGVANTRSRSRYRIVNMRQNNSSNVPGLMPSTFSNDSSAYEGDVTVSESSSPSPGSEGPRISSSGWGVYRNTMPMFETDSEFEYESEDDVNNSFDDMEDESFEDLDVTGNDDDEFMTDVDTSSSGSSSSGSSSDSDSSDSSSTTESGTEIRVSNRSNPEPQPSPRNDTLLIYDETSDDEILAVGFYDHRRPNPDYLDSSEDTTDADDFMLPSDFFRQDDAGIGKLLKRYINCSFSNQKTNSRIISNQQTGHSESDEFSRPSYWIEQDYSDETDSSQDGWS